MSKEKLPLLFVSCCVAAAACASPDEEEVALLPDDKVSIVMSELTGDCQVTAACPGGTQLSCSGTNYQCSAFGNGDPFAHYLEMLSNSSEFGHAEGTYFRVANNSGSAGITCNGASQTCPYYSGTAVVDSSDRSATAGTWPRTVTMGQSFWVEFTNRTYSTKFPAIRINSASFGSIVSPISIGVSVVGRDGNGHQQ